MPREIELPDFEYAAIPAPARAEKLKGAKSPAERYAATLTDAINRMAAQGWEYLRADTLPSEERSGLTGRTTLFHNLLIFRRSVKGAGTGRAMASPETAADPHRVFSESMRPAEPLSPAPVDAKAPEQATKS